MTYKRDYDETNPNSIEQYAFKLKGKTFRNIIEDDKYNLTYTSEEGASYDVAKTHENKKNKGNLGQIVEEHFFHYPCNNDSRPDFPEAGVELKVTPYKIGKKDQLSSKERLILTKIDYFKVVEETFENSHLWNKSKDILLVYYLYQKEVKVRLDYQIDYIKLFTPPEQDIKIIEHDFKIITDKIKAGKAHELSEGDTLYLGAATKAASSKDRTGQPYSDEPAKPRAFSYKNSYMTYVLNNYVVPKKKEKLDKIIKDDAVESFEDYVVSKIDEFSGKTQSDLCEQFGINKNPKNLGAILAYHILGVKGNKAEEFQKANIVMKTIRIEKNNTIRENMSFPSFKFKKLVDEKWEDSEFGNYLGETRFLFIVYKYNDKNELVLKGCQFWNMPYNDLNEEVKMVWKRTKNVIKEGLDITIKNGKQYTNLPKQTDNPVCHVRPHAQNAKDTYELPDGRKFTKQSFWLNNSYIKSQLDEKFFE